MHLPFASCDQLAGDSLAPTPANTDPLWLPRAADRRERPVPRDPGVAPQDVPAQCEIAADARAPVEWPIETFGVVFIG